MRVPLSGTPSAAAFTSKRKDLKDIYITFTRSIVDQSAVVWHSGLSYRNKKDIESVQKAAVRAIFVKSYKNYTHSLKKLRLDSLEKRRELLSFRFAKNCLRNEKMKNLFPLRKFKHKMKKRNQTKYEEKKINTKRFASSALPYMTKQLNEYEAKKRKII